MRRSRRITRADQWDIGLLTVLFSVALLCLAAMWRAGELPRVFAYASSSMSRHEMSAQPYADPAPKFDNVQAALAQPVAPGPMVALPPVTPVPLPTIDSAAKKAPVSAKWYDGDKYRYLKTVRMRVTAYSPDEKCCWPYPGTTTASGLSVKTNHGKLVAADTKVLPMHSLVSVPGYHGGEAVPVLDRGGAIKGQRLDVLLPTYSQAQGWGAKMVDVKVYVPIDE